MPVERISEHVWWPPPGPPDRPSLCAIVGERWTPALDAGSTPGDEDSEYFRTTFVH